MTVKTPEEQAALDAQRAAIKTTSFKPEEEIKENEDGGKSTDDERDVDNKSATDKDVSDAETETKEEEIEAAEKTEEDLEAEKAAAKTNVEKARVQRKIDKEVAKRKTLEEEVATLKAQLAAKETAEGDKFTAEDVKKEAKRIAEETINERDFVNASNRLADAAEKVDKDFMKKMKEVAADVAPIPGHMIGILDDLKKKNGGAVLSHLVNNPDAYEEIITLSPLKASAKLVELSIELAAKAEVPKKKLSNLPPPNEPLGGKGGNVSDMVLPKDPTKDMDRFVRVREAQIAARRKAARY